VTRSVHHASVVPMRSMIGFRPRSHAETLRMKTSLKSTTLIMLVVIRTMRCQMSPTSLQIPASKAPLLVASLASESILRVLRRPSQVNHPPGNHLLGILTSSRGSPSPSTPTPSPAMRPIALPQCSKHSNSWSFSRKFGTSIARYCPSETSSTSQSAVALMQTVALIASKISLTSMLLLCEPGFNGL